MALLGIVRDGAIASGGPPKGEARFRVTREAARTTIADGADPLADPAADRDRPLAGRTAGRDAKTV